MRRLDALEELPERLPWPVVTVGTFDGLHVGHQRVLTELVTWARGKSGTAVVVTFEQPPRSVLTGENAPLVTSLAHRLVLLERFGINLCLVLQFTRELAGTRAEDFVRRVIVEGLAARGLVLGHGSAFGHAREGDEGFLKDLSGDLGLEVRSVPAVVLDGEAVSSTRIRSAVLAGDFELAARLLGRPCSVLGTVVKGESRGKKLGFPTANLDLHNEISPPDGVYVARAVFGEESRPALVSIGTRPTFASDRSGETSGRVVEIHLLDFDGQIYGRDIEAQFLEKLRPQKEYATAEELMAQMNQDLRRAREFFAKR